MLCLALVESMVVLLVSCTFFLFFFFSECVVCLIVDCGKDRTDVIASGVGAAAGLGTATLVKNRALFRKQPMLPPTHPNYLDPIFRPRFQYPSIIFSVMCAFLNLIFIISFLV